MQYGQVAWLRQARPAALKVHIGPAKRVAASSRTNGPGKGAIRRAIAGACWRDERDSHGMLALIMRGFHCSAPSSGRGVFFGMSKLRSVIPTVLPVTGSMLANLAARMV